MRWDLFAVLMIVPWIATYLGSLIATYLNIKSVRRQNLLLGFAAGVMIAASVWSLIIPAFNEIGADLHGALIVTIGFLIGCLLMLALDKIVPHQHTSEDKPEGLPAPRMSRPWLLVTAVALHNIPEGLALGVVMAAAMGDTSLTWTAAIVFGIGLALQNFPEGIAVTLPLRYTTMSQKRIHFFGFLASLAEPVSALIGFLLARSLASVGTMFMPILLAMAAGAMIFIVVEELIPESQSKSHGHAATYGFIAGFWIMAVMGIMEIG